LRPRRRPEDRTRPVVQQDRTNEQIRAPRVRLVGPDGEQIGIKDTKEALEFAYSKNLDLVEVAKDADPPVAKVMDYGKWRYEQEQRAKLARKHQSTINIKEIKFRPKIGDHDYETKKGHVVRFPISGRRSRSRSCSGDGRTSIRSGVGCSWSASPRTSRSSARSSSSPRSTAGTW
jgi:translation initiation factor IF-3